MNKRVCVFTPTYNRANTIGRVYHSLLIQDFKDFIWIIVDDGSKDNTKDIIEQFILEKKIDIKYIYQENAGKHVAINRALKETDSELFLIADSDDSFSKDALKTFVDIWDSIEEEKKIYYKGVIAKCYNAESSIPIGKFPAPIFDSNDLDAYFKLRLCFEKWNIIRTDVMKEISFPEPNEKLKFFPESVVWWRMARKYKTRYVDKNIRAYYHDQQNSVIKQKNSRCKENCYLWSFYINEIMDYFKYYPKDFFKAFIGYSRDSILSGKKIKEALEMINGFYRKLIVLIFYPLGYILAKNRKEEK